MEVLHGFLLDREYDIIFYIFRIMDILDQLNSAPSTKSKKKPSILASIQEQPHRSPNLSPAHSPTHFLIPPLAPPRQPIPVSSKDQHASHQFLRHAHFDTNGSSQRVRLSDRDANSISDRVQQIMVYSSLGVIASESSEESKGSGTRRRNQMNEPASKPANPQQVEQLKQKLSASQSKTIQLHNKTTLLQSQLAHSTQQLSSLQQKLSSLETRNSQQRKQLLQEQSQLMQVQREKMARLYEEELARREEMLRWEYEGKLRVGREELKGLRNVNRGYQGLLECRDGVGEEKRRVMEAVEMGRMQELKQKQSNQRQAESLAARSQQFQDKLHSFYTEKQEHDIQTSKIRKQLEQQRLNLKKERVEMLKQLREKQAQEQIQLDNKLKEYESKARNLEIQCMEVQMLKEVLGKEREQVKRIGELATEEYRRNMEKVRKERDRLCELEKELIEKIQIVELHWQKGNRPTIITHRPQLQTDLVLPDKQNTAPTPNPDPKPAITPQSPPKTPNKTQYQKINVGSYISKLNKSSTKGSGRAIYKLQEYYL